MDHTETFLDLLSLCGGSSQVAWKSALVARVRAVNQDARFNDILQHPEFAESPLVESPDVLSGLGIAAVSALYEFVLARENMSIKRSKGQFFTPEDVSMFMASKASDFEPGRWLDPCCGVGNLTHSLASVQPDPEKFLLESCLHLDIDSLALLTARVLLTLHFQASETHLFSQLEGNFAQADFLDRSLIAAPAFQGEFDYIIMNPPYVQTPDRSRSFTTSKSRDLFAFFFERALTEADGAIAITPQTFTNGIRHKELRELMLRRSNDLTIYCFDNVPDTIFRGLKHGSENTNQVNSTRAAITVAKSKRCQGESRFRITPLLRWRTAERMRLFDEADHHLASPVTVTSRLFPKVTRGLEQQYEDMRTARTRISDCLTSDGHGVSLNIATTPRYFITATERDLDRSSVVSISLTSTRWWKIAYLTLNSSLAYFWWRVCDGGMTLSRSTLLSMPLDDELDVETPEVGRLIEALRLSEQTNLVVKMNAGKLNQNVKHDLELVARVNEVLCPRKSGELLLLHENSSLR